MDGIEKCSDLEDLLSASKFQQFSLNYEAAFRQQTKSKSFANKSFRL